MIVTLDAKRRLTIPAALAPVSPGDYFDATFDADEDTFMFRRLARKESWLTVLKACPVSPDDVRPRRRAPLAARSYELAARHRCDLPAGQAPRRFASDRLARNGTRPVLHERSCHCATGILGAHEGGASASGPPSLADTASGRTRRTCLRVQRFSRPRLGGPGTIARQSRSAHACRR